ncbi:MAG TPA: BPSS1780 family membrane protein [Burkholderiaceae bacterium]|nr:BPSS1780 family membrane protein [Burkholderiaceae bacterium]
MQIRELPAAQGLRWIRDGWRLFRRQPFALAALSAIYMLLVLFPATVPLLGPALAGIIAPFASFGMMEACRDADRGQTPTPLAFGVALRADPPRGEMIRLGFIHAAILVVVGLALAVAGLDATMQILPPAEGSDVPSVQVDVPLLLLQFLVFLPLEMAMWFAPVFVGWHRMPAPKAMFFSFFACWSNRWPLLLYAGATVLACAGTGSLVLSLLAALVTSQELLSLLSAPLVLVGSGFVLTTLYPIYRSIVVGPGETA